MKNYFLTVLMVMLMGCTTTVIAQQKGQQPQQTQVTDVVNTPDTAGIEAYSDTTSNAIAPDTTSVTKSVYEDIDDDEKFIRDFINDSKGWVIVLMIIAIIAGLLICLAPFIIIGFIIYLIVKNRRMKSELNEQASEAGRNTEMTNRAYSTVSDVNMDTQNKAIKNIFLGIGLIIALNMFGLDGLAGIGWIVVCWGVGQLIIARTSKKKIPVEEPQKETETKASTDEYVDVTESEMKN